MVRENENPAYFPLLFNILGQKITNMRRQRGLTEDLIKEFIPEVKIRVELLECLAILKAVPVEVLFYLTRKIYFAIINILISLFTIEKILFVFFELFVFLLTIKINSTVSVFRYFYFIAISLFSTQMLFVKDFNTIQMKNLTVLISKLQFLFSI